MSDNDEESEYTYVCMYVHNVYHVNSFYGQT